MAVNYLFYLIVDDSICSPHLMPQVVKNLLYCGITCLQLRMKQSSSAIIINTAYAIKELIADKNISLIINDHVDIVKKVDADGVHLGQHDMPIRKARDYLGENKLIGLSIENHFQALASKNEPVDYFGVGPIFPTTTKRDAAKPIGLTHLKEIIAILPKPVVALGGICAENMNAVLLTGAAGIAIASYILASSKPQQAAKNIAALLAEK